MQQNLFQQKSKAWQKRYKKGDMIANDTIVQRRPNDAEVNFNK